ncbi:hypothetical protein PVBG_06347 [Plasmodium vivax Brazil I]|uniref:PIR Superfamily Protein n=1 Tax=Plasmodium vivax (strain Brazil I) TaxID=1033975 RepID=A0A0J9T0M3_PLAV1|nr:hypothetical protein PVBG_06347 [Plasmodium vivax Brazil I]
MSSLKIIEAIRGLLGLRSEELHSEKFYHQLKFDNDNLSDYNKECDELKEPYNKQEIRRICKQVLKFLKTRSSKSDDEKSVRDDCVLLNYWIYDKLSKHYGPENSSETSDCPDFYERCKVHDPNKFLHELTCHNEMKDIKFSLELPKLPGEQEEEEAPDADDKSFI